MIKVVVIVVAIICICMVTSHAEVVEVPLPGLLGMYTRAGPIEQRTSTWTAPRLLFIAIRIRFSGESTVRDWYCDLEGPFPISVKFYAEINDPITPGLWFGGGPTPNESGQFQIESAFHADQRPNHRTPTWDFLIQYGSCVVGWQGAGNPAPDCASHIRLTPMRP